jgi:hypothetical protein
MRLRSLLIVLPLLSFLLLPAQPKNFTQIEDADEHFDNGNYLFAIPAYRAELKKDPDNLKAKFRLGICYLNTRVSRDEAIPYLEDAAKQPKMDADIWLYLGKAYQVNNLIDKAIASYERFKTLKPKFAAEADRYIAQCRNAQKFMAKPANVSLQNLGKQINSEEPDYNPFLDREEMFLVFTSRRRENVGGKKIEVDGYRSSDIYQSAIDNGQWQQARNSGRGVNTNLDEQVVGLSADGLEMYVYLDHIEKFGDIYVSARREESGEFLKPKPLEIPEMEQIETSGCVNEDGTLLVFSRRKTPADNSDLYLARKLPNGKWGIPVRLPDNINSPYNEDNPFISHDGKTLYFASDGHNAMGGYDLFKCGWDQKNNTYSDPVNLGYPINSTDDDRSICVTADNRIAYISAYRPNGFGDLDLYRVRFNEKEPVIALYTGKVFMGDTALANQPKDYAVTIIATNTESNFELTFVPHPKTGRFVLAMPAGVYEITCQSRGYLKFMEKITVTDMGRPNLERKMNIILKKDKKTAEGEGKKSPKPPVKK